VGYEKGIFPSLRTEESSTSRSGRRKGKVSKKQRFGSPVAETNVVDSANTGIVTIVNPSFGSGGNNVTIMSNHIGGTQMFGRRKRRRRNVEGVGNDTVIGIAPLPGGTDE
jgi:hypothetical protein